MWAAEGLAQTCYLTYLDQPTWLSPDEIIIYSTPDRKQPNRQILGGPRWIYALEKWRASGSRGTPPGLAQRKPVMWKAERDYHVVKPWYLLRPEVSMQHSVIWARITLCADAVFRCRLSNLCIFSGALQVIHDGESMAGPSSKLSKSRRRLIQDIHVSWMCNISLQFSRMICQGESPFRNHFGLH